MNIRRVFLNFKESSEALKKCQKENEMAGITKLHYPPSETYPQLGLFTHKCPACGFISKYEHKEVKPKKV